jgi:hypothetical protein
MPKKIVTPKTPKTKAYKLTVGMNGQVYKCSTDDLETALQELRPDTFKTKVVITVANKFSSVERVLMIPKARMLWMSKLAMSVFVGYIKRGLKNA